MPPPIVPLNRKLLTRVRTRNEKSVVRPATAPVSLVAAKKAKATTVAPVAKEPDKSEIDRIQRGESVDFLLSHPEQ